MRKEKLEGKRICTAYMSSMPAFRNIHLTFHFQASLAKIFSSCFGTFIERNGDGQGEEKQERDR